MEGYNMKKQLIIGVIATLLTTSAFAGVKEKKAMRAADESIAQQLEKVQASCGNPELAIAFAWDDYKAMMKANTDTIKKERYKKQWVISHAGERAVASLEAMTKICQDDVDYKEEIASITSIMIKPKADLKDYDSEFNLDDTTINVTFGHLMTRRSSDFVKPIKELF